ncbi:MAG: transcriptional repressor [Anaerolineales bacterium]|nr:transcriptional repressor [Anaerolineales bacterium]
MTSGKSLPNSLHASGMRLTPQRELVLEIIEGSAEHLDAEEIWQRARSLNKRINLATVYRTLSILKGMSLVQQRYFAREHKREVYETVSKQEHFHFTCVGCGRLIEFQTRRIEQVRAELAEQMDVAVTHACICFEGYCEQCSKD